MNYFWLTGESPSAVSSLTPPSCCKDVHLDLSEDGHGGRFRQHLVPVRLETEGGLCGDLVDKFQADVAETADRDWVPS